MTYSPLLLLHICGGIAGFLSGATALVARKGAGLHRKAGNIFVISMLIMAASGGSLALLKGQRVNVIAALFTLYLIATAWLTVRRPENETGAGEVGLLAMGLASGTISLLFGWQASHAAAARPGAAAPYVVFGVICFLSSSGDARMLLRGGIAGGRRLARHLWRMGFGLFIATGSFFLGRAGDPVLRRTGLRATLFTDEIRRTHLPEVPVILVALLTIYWLGRVLLTGAYDRAQPRRPSPGKSPAPLIAEERAAR